MLMADQLVMGEEVVELLPLCSRESEEAERVISPIGLWVDGKSGACGMTTIERVDAFSWYRYTGHFLSSPITPSLGHLGRIAP